MKVEKWADDLIQEIAEVLSEYDGETIAEIANLVITGKVTYLEDSMFEVEYPED